MGGAIFDRLHPFEPALLIDGEVPGEGRRGEEGGGGGRGRIPGPGWPGTGTSATG